MTKLPTYNSLREKSEVFQQVIINTKSDVADKFIEKNKVDIGKGAQRDLIYRGVTNARYKLYNSAQRSFAEKELQNITTYDAFIEGNIEKARKFQEGLLRKYLEGLGINFDIPVLSFLQHYGAPTPLIDWTYNIEVALFFTTDGLQHIPSDNDIDNYFSIYCIDKRLCKDELVNISEVLIKYLAKARQIVHKNSNVDVTSVLNLFNECNFNSFKDYMIFFVSDFERRADIPAITTHSNLNIINQEGLFVFNSNENEPLENFFGANRDPLTSGLPRIICYDFHKSLYYYVLAKITEVRRSAELIPLTREFIYPEERLIAGKAFENNLSR